MTVTLGRPLTTEPPTPSAPDALDVVRRARRAPVRHHRRLLAGLLVALVGAFAARVLLGDYTVTVPDFVRILGGEQIPGATYIVMESKLPRAALAVLVGVAFGVGGAIFQTTLRNPLASPDIVGVSLGASAAAVTVIALAGWTGWPVSAAAIAGALGVALAVRAVAGDHGGFRLVLAGIGLAAAMQSVIQYVFTRVDEYDVQLVLRWLTGSVNGVAWPTIGLLALALSVLLPATAWAARSLRRHRARRRHRRRARRRSRPHRRADAPRRAPRRRRRGRRRPRRVRRVPVRPDRACPQPGPYDVAGGGLVGALIVLVGDYAGAYAFADLNLPVGVVTGAFGAPFLLWLLARGP